ncbi:MAG: N-formylglutamate amidohydrolase [Pseudomonadota bacterium]
MKRQEDIDLMPASELFPVQAYSELNPLADQPCLFVCEHASNYIPPAFSRLGLTAELLEEHISWDFGAREVLEYLCQERGNAAVLCNYSRLMIDCNRPLDVDSSIPEKSEIYPVPGNQNLSEAERNLRVEHIFNPFHAAVLRQVERLKVNHDKFPVVGIHSFTPVFESFERPWKFSVMWKDDSPFTRAVVEHFQQHELANFVGFNEPYSAKTIRAYTTEHYEDVHGLPTVIFEVRQDLLRDQEGVRHWGDIIKQALEVGLEALDHSD